MAQQQISTSHQPDLAHHVTQGRAWLEISAKGENTAALSYSAFELRFAVERLAIHYWATLLQRRPEEHEMHEIESFKRVERRIYELAGHQREIDGHFEFMRIVLEAMKIDAPLITPKIGSLAKYWHECSELCHITWPLASSVDEVRASSYLSLSAIAEELTLQVQSMGWPALQEQGFAELRNRYVAGTATKADVLEAIARSGIWARVEYSDGREPHFLGEPVPVSTPKGATRHKRGLTPRSSSAPTVGRMTADTAQVRLFLMADTSAVRELIVAGLTERWGAYDRHLNPDLEDFTNFYSACVVLVAERKRRIIGVGVLQPTSSGAAQVVRMSVAHDCRRQGIGTLVLHRLLQEASKRGLSEVSLETTASWSSAVEFYEHRGFVRTKILNGNQYFALRENAA